MYMISYAGIDRFFFLQKCFQKRAYVKSRKKGPPKKKGLCQEPIKKGPPKKNMCKHPKKMGPPKKGPT